MHPILTIASVLLIALLPAGTRAQDARNPGPRPVLLTEGRPGATAPATDVAEQEPVGRQEPRSPRRPRRKNSMVGYLDDGTIGTRFRLRFEAAFENHRPDRAEYFYAKCGCYSGLEGEPEHDPNAPGPGPGIATDIDYQQLYLTGEYVLRPRLSVFATIPIRWIQPQAFQPPNDPGFSNQGGLGDIRIGGKYGIIDEDDVLLTAQVRAYLPTGDAGKGLGTDHASIEPAFLYHQWLLDRLLVEAQVGLWVPLDGSDPVPPHEPRRFSGAVLGYGVGPSYELYRNDRLRFAPVVEVMGWRVLDGLETDGDPARDASGTDILNLKVGARVMFAQGSVYFGYGTALTSASWYEDVLRLEYRHEF